MPKFTQQELEEIRENTERIEQERLARGSSKKKNADEDEDSNEGLAKKSSKKSTRSSSKKASKKKRKKGDYSVAERLIALVLLGITIAISYIVMVLNS